MTLVAGSRLLLVVAAAFVAGACSGEPPVSVDSMDAGTAQSEPPDRGAMEPRDGGTIDMPADEGLPAPTLDSVEPMGGGLHVSWTVDPQCNEVDVLRSDDAGPFVDIITMPAEIPFFHDGTVGSSVTYCYRLQCVVRGDTSDHSNEICAVP